MLSRVICRRHAALLSWAGRSKFRRCLHSWPTASNPTPYQIFGIDPRSSILDKKQLQNVYFELVKQYHPDRSTTGDPERFKKVVEAHDILKDDAKRRSYDFTQAMSRSSSSPRYHHRQDTSFGDDFNVNYWSSEGQKSFDKGLYESRVWVLKLVVGLTTVFAILNFLLLRKMSDTRNELTNAETERVAAHLAEARGFTDGNPFANSPSDRIARFLKQRQNLLDKFDHEFSYDKLRSGASRRELGRVGDTVYYDKPDGSVEAEKDAPTEVAPRRPPSNGKGQPQAKPNVGPVAEYFGRS